MRKAKNPVIGRAVISGFEGNHYDDSATSSGVAIVSATETFIGGMIDAGTVVTVAAVSGSESYVPGSLTDAAAVTGIGVISASESRTSDDLATVTSIGVVSGSDTTPGGNDAATVLGVGVPSASETYMANRMGLIVYGGATSSLDGNDPTPYSHLLLSMFKYAGTTAFATSLRSTYPNLKKLYGYVTAADVKGVGSVDCGLTKDECDTHDATLGGAASGDYWLLRGGAAPQYPSGTLEGAYSSSPPDGNTVMYLGNIHSSTYRARWVSNTIAKAQAAGLDGIFIDNTLGYLSGSAPVAPETGVAYTDATWATEMANFIANVVPQLQAAGLEVICNTHKNTDAPIEIDFMKSIGTYGGVFSEYWMQNAADTTKRRLVGTAWNDQFHGWINLLSGVEGLGQRFHAEVDGTNTDAHNYSWASFLLRWDGTTESVHWATPGLTATWAPTVVHPGIPAANTEEVDAAGNPVTGNTPTHLYRRYYDRGIVLINADPTATYTITSYGDGRTYKDATGATVATGFTLAPGQAKVLRSDTLYTPGAAPTDWFRVAENAPQYTSGTPTFCAGAPSHAVSINDLILVGVTRSFGSNDLASETVTDTLGNTYVQVPSLDYDGSDVQSMTLYYSVVTHAGRPIIYANYPNASNFSGMEIVVFRNPGKTITFDTSATYTGSPPRQVLAGAGTDTITLPLTLATTNELVFAIWGNVSSGSNFTSAGTGFTIGMYQGNALFSEWKKQATSGAMNATASPAGAMNVIGVAAAFKAV